ncbi:MAG: DUF3043 domain-containing protein [Nocardioidaceae bacterium]
MRHVSVFGRRTSSDPAADESSQREAMPEGKGHPTPKRKESEAARKKRMAPPRNKKEANKLHRERMKAQRVKQREAMQGGDDRYLPARDQGKVKRFIRDYVDVHRTIGEFLIPIFIIIFVLVYIRTAWAAAMGTYMWIVILLLLAFDSTRIVRGVKRGITERFGAEETSGITMYTLMRSWQMRRLRLPKPQVKAGQEIP